MKGFQAILVSASFVVVVFAIPKPQDGVSPEDILNNDAKYNKQGSSGNSDQDSLNAIFGGFKGISKGSSGSRGISVSPSSERKNNPNFGTPVATVVDSETKPCNFYFNAGYRCVPYYQCFNGTIVVDGGGLFDIRTSLAAVILDPEKSKCPGDLEVCCIHPDFEKTLVSGQAALSPLTLLSSSSSTSSEEPRQNQSDDGPSGQGILVSKQYSSRCGQRHTGGVGVRILNQKEDGMTQFGEWPHMCAVLNRTIVNNEDVNLYVCGCSLISDRIVLTAAHCVSNFSPNNIKVRAGEWDTQQTSEPFPHQDRVAKHVSVHPGFNQLNLQNDFALIHLSEPFVLSYHIDTACLPDNLNFEGRISPKNCFATGWGKDRFGKPGEYQVKLKKVPLDLVPQEDCETKLRATRLGRFFNLDKSFTCAGGKIGKDTCTGDGGGPLVCPTPTGDTYIQVGIVAWGVGCGDEIPGVYANVSQALCFIDWATRCVEGPDANYYGFVSCGDWALKEKCFLQQQLQELNRQEELLSENIVEKGKITRQKKKLEELIPRFEAAINGCSTGSKIQTCDPNGIVNNLENPFQIPLGRNKTNVNITPRTIIVEVPIHTKEENAELGPPGEE